MNKSNSISSLILHHICKHKNVSRNILGLNHRNIDDESAVLGANVARVVDTTSCTPFYKNNHLPGKRDGRCLKPCNSNTSSEPASASDGTCTKPNTNLRDITINDSNHRHKGHEGENELVTIHFETCNQIKPISIQKGEILRTALMKRGISPHNGRSRLINCRGLGTCGTCAVEVRAEEETRTEKDINVGIIGTSNHDRRLSIQPPERTTKEHLRLNLPPHGSQDQSKYLRLACQIQIFDDVHVRKKNGFWGQSSIEGDVADKYDAELYFGNMEFILDNKSPPFTTSNMNKSERKK